MLFIIGRVLCAFFLFLEDGGSSIFFLLYLCIAGVIIINIFIIIITISRNILFNIFNSSFVVLMYM